MLTRQQMYGLVHKGAFCLPGIDSDDAYRDWLAINTRIGKEQPQRSCTTCTNKQLGHLVGLLRRLGALDGNARGGKGIDRPTSRQWAKLAGLGRAMGWDGGLEDARMQAFIKRTAKVDNTRFLTRKGITECITGLEQWAKQH